MDVKIPLDAFLVLFCLKTGLRRKIHHKSSLFELEVRSVKNKGDKQGVCLTALRLAVVSWMPLFVFLLLREVFRQEKPSKKNTGFTLKLLDT